jgi:hypothetical protein
LYILRTDTQIKKIIGEFQSRAASWKLLKVWNRLFCMVFLLKIYYLNLRGIFFLKCGILKSKTDKSWRYICRHLELIQTF